MEMNFIIYSYVKMKLSKWKREKSIFHSILFKIQNWMLSLCNKKVLNNYHFFWQILWNYYNIINIFFIIFPYDI